MVVVYSRAEEVTEVCVSPSWLQADSYPGPQEGMRPSVLLGYKVIIIPGVCLPASWPLPSPYLAHYSLFILQREKQALRNWNFPSL